MGWTCFNIPRWQIWGHTIEESFVEKRQYDKRSEKCFLSIDHIYILNNKTLDTFKRGYKTMHERRKTEKMFTLWGKHGLPDLPGLFTQFFLHAYNKNFSSSIHIFLNILPSLTKINSW